MPDLLDIPYQEFISTAEMERDRLLNPWNKKRYVGILKDTAYGNGFALYLFTNNKLYFLQAEKAAQVIGIPPGGTEGQILSKRSDDNFDVEWIDKPITLTNSLLIKPGVRLQIKPGITLKIK